MRIGEVKFCNNQIDVQLLSPAMLVVPMDLHEHFGDTLLRMQREPRVRRDPGHKPNMISYRLLVPGHH